MSSDLDNLIDSLEYTYIRKHPHNQYENIIILSSI